MNTDSLRKLWKAEEAQAFGGWDFSHLDGRWQEEELCWDYRALLLERLTPSDRLLDMGTGGGEFLLTLGHPLALTAVTEGYPPNFQLCREKLAPLGIEVRAVSDDDRLPFPADRFDVAANRHESFDPREVYRVLSPGGRFVTQQMGGRNNNGLSARVIPGFRPRFPALTLENTVLSLQNAGFEVLFAAEAFPRLRFFDVGALVYFAKVIEWEFPGFTVDEGFERLMDCQAEIDRAGFLESREHRFALTARKR